MIGARTELVLCAAQSIDGKLSSVARDDQRLASKADLRRFLAEREAADALLVGAGTLRAGDPPMLASAAARERRISRGLRPQPARVIVSKSLDFPMSGRACRLDAESPVIVLTPSLASEELAAQVYDAGHELIFFNESPRGLGAALAGLAAKHSWQRVLAEGAGRLNASLLAENLVDELVLTLCPLILGGVTAPGLCDGDGFSLSSAPRFRLTESLSSESELFLRYRRL